MQKFAMGGWGWRGGTAIFENGGGGGGGGGLQSAFGHFENMGGGGAVCLWLIRKVD